MVVDEEKGSDSKWLDLNVGQEEERAKGFR